jgi:hypothetical protein
MIRPFNIAAFALLYAVPMCAVYAQTTQTPDSSKWMCRNLADSGGFVYRGETIFGSQACRPIPDAPRAATSSGTPNSGPTQLPEPQKTSSTAVQYSSGRPMVTTLKHQTQGETWEDFMRISGSKMNLCASSKTQGAQWCDAFKQAEAGEDATITDSEASGSVSLIFSERRLVQVVVQVKANWAKSLEEFGQLYGTPDSQTPNSAVWTFPDDGRISASGQPGNLVRADFYCQNGKQRDREVAPTTGGADSSQPPSEIADSSSTQGIRSTFNETQADYLGLAELQTAAQGGGKGVTITAGSAMGQALVAGLANVNLAQYASIQLFRTESWIALSAQLARRQYLQFDPANLPHADTLRGLTVVALGGAYGTHPGPVVVPSLESH